MIIHIKATEQNLWCYLFYYTEQPRVKISSTYRVKFGYMVDRRSIIFSKLLEGLALSTTVVAVAAAAAMAVLSPPTAA